MPPLILDSARTDRGRPAGATARFGASLWRDRRARWALIVIGVIAAAAVLGPMLTPYPPNDTPDITGLIDAPSSWAHPLGTDRFSRDLLSRMLSGARVSLSVAALAVLLSTTLGTAYGLIAGYFEGAVDTVLMRILDAFLAIPRILIIIALVTLWGRGATDAALSAGGVIVVIGVTGWLGVSRLVRAETRTARTSEYVMAARALGARGDRILLTHLLPNVIGPVIVSATLGIAGVIAIESALSYIGYGIPLPSASWGSILREALDEGGSRRIAWIAGATIVGTVMAFNALGDALRDVLTGRSRASIASGAGSST